MTDTPGVTITLKDIYDKVETMSVKIDRIATTHDVHAQTIDDHEGRIRDLEKMVWKASGVATVLGIIGSTIVQLVIK